MKFANRHYLNQMTHLETPSVESLVHPFFPWPSEPLGSCFGDEWRDDPSLMANERRLGFGDFLKYIRWDLITTVCSVLLMYSEDISAHEKNISLYLFSFSFCFSASLLFWRFRSSSIIDILWKQKNHIRK